MVGAVFEEAGGPPGSYEPWTCCDQRPGPTAGYRHCMQLRPPRYSVASSRQVRLVWWATNNPVGCPWCSAGHVLQQQVPG